MSEGRQVLALWFFLLVALSVWRLAFVFSFWPHLAPATGGDDIATAFLHGVRFDLRIATAISAPAWLLALVAGLADTGVWGERLRRLTAITFIALTPLLGCVAIAYYAEFDRPFDLNLFNFFYDDTEAILATMAIEYSLTTYLMVAALLSGIGGLAFWGWRRITIAERVFLGIANLRGWRRPAALVAGVGLLVGAARGSFGERPAMRKWSSVTEDRVLNDAVLPPYSWIVYALRDHARLARTPRLDALLPGGDVRAAAQRFFADPKAATNLDDYFVRRAAGPKGEPPRHIFLIVMESYDIWPLLWPYREWGASTRLTRLAQSGVFFDRFLPGSESTMATIATLLLGLPDAGLFTARQPSSQQAYPTSLPATMQRLGYRARLFYAGMLSWQRLGDFARAQGFSEVYGRSHIAPSPGGPWGLDDEELFAFVRSTLDAAPKSFNVIITLSNHPPYDLDLEALGFATPAGFVPGPRFAARHLGHLWYADQQVGEFVSHTEATNPGALFVLTGDHYSRRHPHPRAKLFETSAVPLVLFGPRVLAGIRRPPEAAGSHLDILPTLVELCAPQGFAYHAVGRDLLTPSPNPIGFGYHRIIGTDFLLDLRTQPQLHREPGAPDVDVDRLVAAYRDLLAIAWWRIQRGAQLPE